MVTLTVREALRAVSAYPIPDAFIARALTERGLSGGEEYDGEVAISAAFKLAQADVFDYLSAAPNINQGGISFSLSGDERKAYRGKADALYCAFDPSRRPKYGYKGNRL